MAMTNGQQYYKRLIEPIEPQMISVIARIVPNSDDAMDVLHNALAAIWSKLGKIDKLTNPHAYILRICVNQAYDAMRKANIRSFHESKVYPRQCKAFENECNNENIDEQMLTYVFEAIRKLSRRQAKCFLLRAVDNFSFLEIADILSCSEPTARSHYSKAKAKICGILMKQGILTIDGETKNEIVHSLQRQ